MAFVGAGSTITNAFVQQWDTSVRTAAQQSESRLMKAVTDRGIITGDGYTINNLGSIELEDNVVRHGDTEWADIDHSNRLAVMQDFYRALPLDRNDIPKMIINPVTGGDYMRQLMNAKNRKIDKVIYNALGGTINSKDGVTANVLPAGQKIAHGSAGFTKAKIIQARGIFRANEADEEAGEELFMMYNNEAMIDILSDTTLTTVDQLAVKMLQEGKVAQSWMGFTWIPYQGLTFTASTYYSYAWAKSGVHLGKGYEEGNVTRRGDKKDLWQVSMGASYGAGRQDEYKVVEIAFQ
ncbi:MAG: hypothetical protein A2143_10840 [Gallionellales bacterium RBG_16_57_15]|nr:MAG: hypothetical protein A2143_10840 [Gallionellales bacterium RBG_16_57_15]